MARSSVLDTLSAPLCDAVLERTDSAAMLTELERSNLFVIPLDATGSEYRYHHLFAAFLTRQLNAGDPGAVPGLHARASRWFEDHGDVERPSTMRSPPGRRPREHARRADRGPDDLLRPAGHAQPLVRRSLLAGGPARPRARGMRALAADERAGPRRGRRWLRVAEDGPDYGPLAIGISSFRAMVAMVSSTYLSRGIADAERSAKFVLEASRPKARGDTQASYRLDRLSSSLVAAGRRGRRLRRPGHSPIGASTRRARWHWHTSR